MLRRLAQNREAARKCRLRKKVCRSWIYRKLGSVYVNLICNFCDSHTGLCSTIGNKPVEAHAAGTGDWENKKAGDIDISQLENHHAFFFLPLILMYVLSSVMLKHIIEFLLAGSIHWQFIRCQLYGIIWNSKLRFVIHNDCSFKLPLKWSFSSNNKLCPFA